MAEANSCLVVGDFTLRLDPGDVEDKYKEVAERELRETPEVRDAAVKALRELVKAEDEFNFPLDGPAGDAILLRFLRCCKFYPESALKKMKGFFAFKTANPSLCKDLLREEDRNILNQQLFTIVPARDQHGRLTSISESGKKWIPSQCSLHDFLRGIIISTEGASISSTVQVTGYNLIIDYADVGWTHLKEFTPSTVMKMVHYIQDYLPLRLKAIHIVNQAYIFTLIFAIFKPFLNEKLKSRMYLHGKNYESLLKHIDAKALPRRFGGELDLPEIGGTQLFDFLSYHKKYYEDIAAVEYRANRK